MTIRVSRKQAVETLMTMLTTAGEKKDPWHTPVFVAIVGGSASGKGHLIDELLGRLNGPGMPRDKATTLPLDAYYLGSAERRLRGAAHFDQPEAIDLALAADHLAAMRVGKGMKIPWYDFSVGERGGEEHFTAKRFVLIDGLFALTSPKIRALADISVFIDCDHYSSMLRRLFRDPGPSGRTKQSSREVLEQYFTQVWPAKKKFIDPTAIHADVVVESHYDAEQESAGRLHFQLKARAPKLSDEATAYLAGATRLGGKIRQVDRFMRLKGSGARRDILRLRLEPDSQDDILLTYKGPLITIDGIGGRTVTSPVALPREALRWFSEDYLVEATIEKTRVLFETGGVLIARDCVKGLGNFIEVRTTIPTEVHRIAQLLHKLCPGAQQTNMSYYELRMSGSSASVT
jgi:uridine kinase/adenylate cyclase class IV